MFIPIEMVIFIAATGMETGNRKIKDRLHAQVTDPALSRVRDQVRSQVRALVHAQHNLVKGQVRNQVHVQHNQVHVPVHSRVQGQARVQLSQVISYNAITRTEAGVHKIIITTNVADHLHQVEAHQAEVQVREG